jgi:hypothetical protein
MALSVYTVYTALKDLANKDQRGFITPDVFNSLAQPAQMMVFNDMLESVKRKRRIRQGQIDGGFNLSSLKRIKEDLSIFAKDLPIAFGIGGTAEKPEDFAYSIAATKHDGTPIDILYDENKTAYLLRSSLGKPTVDNPVLVMSSSLQIYPASVSSIILSYYKTPSGVDGSGLPSSTLPTYAYTTLNNIETYDPTNSVDFELPEFYMPYLLIELGRMAGLNLRDRDIMAYSQTTRRDNDLLEGAT